MKESRIKVRSLVVDDLFCVAKMLISITGDAKDAITELIIPTLKEKSVKDDKLRQLEVGLSLATVIFRSCLMHAEKDMKEWMGDLVGVDGDAFGKMPIDTPLDILEQLDENEDIKSFFSKAFALFKKMNKSAKKSIEK